MEEKSLGTECVQLTAVRVGTVASPGQGWALRGHFSLCTGPWLSPHQSICGYLWSIHGVPCTFPGGIGISGIKDSGPVPKKLVGS